MIDGIANLKTLFFLFVLLHSCQSIYEDISIDPSDLPEVVDYNFHVKPILSDRCFNCHGPDEESRKANLRLDIEDWAKGKLAGGQGRAIVAGNAKSSELIKRLLYHDPDLVMPPPESNLSLTPYEVGILAKWIDQGAEWKTHWAFVKPSKPEVPNSSQYMASNEIDYFIHEKLSDTELSPLEEAKKETLLRRVYFDLTGLPPSPSDIRDFLDSDDPNAYEHIVDQLLSSTASAERLTTEWLDVARYADSHGLHADGYRMMWPWRDWVIKAFESNMPYDQFITKQLAGDLLPNATKEDILATAFNRNHAMTAEGGAIDEEWRLNYVWDRTETMSTALMGLTMGCAKCHDHKYDPFSQKEYFELTAFFNNVHELGMTGDDGNYGPMLLLTTPEQEASIAQVNASIKEKLTELENQNFDIDQVEAYINGLGGSSPQRIGHYPLDRVNTKVDDNGNKRLYFDNNRQITSQGTDRLVSGLNGMAIQFTKDYNELHIDDLKPFGGLSPFSVGMWIKTSQLDSSKTQTLIGNTGEKNNFWRGWDFYLDGQNHLNVRLIHSLPHNYIHVTSEEAVDIETWTHVAFTYDGTQRAKGLRVLMNGTPQEKNIEFDNLYKDIYPIQVASHVPFDRPLRIGKSYRNYTGENGIYYGLIDDISVYKEEMSPYELSIDAGLNVQGIKDAVTNRKDSKYANLKNELKSLLSERNKIIDPIDEIMVMRERETPRTTYAYNRGEYLHPMYEVEASTPEVLLGLGDYPQNRLGLSQWLFDPDNPLTARVTVNRYWQLIFGRGLVTTPEDFGVQGSLPTHPRLLDWLSTSFIESGWDIRALLKKMVMSSTYRQSSIGSEKDMQIDPENNYYARGGSYRRSAEMIRDNALVASGLLAADIGGESVKPYQPEGLWIEKGNFSRILLRYHADQGDSLYRRSLYTFVKRTSPHPMMTTFDAPNREVCTVKREITNTPLQALVLLNDPQFVEAAKVMAQRIQYEGGDSIEQQISYAYLCALGRQPDDDELRITMNLFKDQHEFYEQNKRDAASFLNIGDYELDPKLDLERTAALAVVSNTLLNHDESYIKR